MGPEELILGLFHASVKIHPPFLNAEQRGKMTMQRKLENPTDLTFFLQKEGEGKKSPIIELHPHSMVMLSYPADVEELRFRLLNCWTGSREHPVVQFD